MSTTVILDGSPVEAVLLGGKGYALNRLIAFGEQVPETGVVTTRAYRRFMHHSGLDHWVDRLDADTDHDARAEGVDKVFLDAPMPESLANDVLRLAAKVRSGGRLAIRSSASAEDLEAASFAGQYRSFLEIEDDEEVLRSIRLVWASLWHPAPRSYRAHKGVPEADLTMAVVVMRLVEARRAGVVFTVNPAGDGTSLRIEAVDGLAEQLVSGEVTPDAFVLSRLGSRRSSIDPVIDEVVASALRLEDRFEGPQDVEWAHDGDRLYIVQARPITTLSHDDSADGFDTTIGTDDTYTTAGIAEALPGVLPPLQWTTAAPLVEEGFRRLFDDLGALPEEADHIPFLARVNGRAVLSLDLMKAAAEQVPGGSSDEIERQYFGRVISDEPTEAAPVRGPFKGVRNMLAGFREITARRRFRFEALASLATIQLVLHDPPDCDIAPVEDLLGYRHRLIDLASRTMAAEVAVAAAAAAAYRGVELFLEPHVGDEAAGLAQRLTSGGLDPCGAQVALHTCDLARVALEDESVSSALATAAPDEKGVREILARTKGGRILLNAVDEELGYAGSAAVFAGETWAESEALAWQLISQAVQVEQRGRTQMIGSRERTLLLEEIEERFSTSWKYRLQRILTGQVVDIRKRMLRRLVNDAVEFLHLREKTKSAVLALGGEVRRVHLALGQRLHRAGVLDHPGDVDLLSAHELGPSCNGNGPGRWELRRRAAVLEHLRASTSIPQIFTGDPARRVQTAPSTNDGITFSGWAASGGVYEGTARVITAAGEPIGPGEILVARTTDPAWTPLFLTAGGIVVEEGGPLSHAAIIARELGLPAVLNVPGLISHLEGRDTRLRVDGDAGVVEILDQAKTSEEREVASA